MSIVNNPSGNSASGGPPSGRLRVAPVLTPGDGRAFIRLPFELYRQDPFWVPPLLSEEADRWDPRRNASLTRRPHARFLAIRDGRVIGRIAANLEPAPPAQIPAGTGFFGFFECAADIEAASALLAAAEEWLLINGATEAIGPVNLTTHDEVGLLTEGFGDRPRLLSPYNPPHYPVMLEACGYRELRRYYAYRWTPRSQANEPMRRLVRSLRDRAGNLGLVLRRPDPAHWEAEIRRLHTLYNVCFEHVWGFAPIAEDEFMQRADRFRRFYDPGLVVMADVGGETVGFGLSLPDINSVLHGLNGRLWPFGWLKAIFLARRIRSARFVLLGVRPDFAGAGIGALIADEMAARGKALNIVDAELSLVDADNANAARVVAAAGCGRIKTYTLYAKALKDRSGGGSAKG